MKKSLLVLIAFLTSYFSSAQNFSYDKIIKGASTLNPSVSSLNQTTGFVEVNGVDSKAPIIPFKFEWGDGTSSTGFFPTSHTYADKTKDYILKVTATYSDGSTDFVLLNIIFTSSISIIRTIQLPSSLAVEIPTSVNLQSTRLPSYGIPNILSPFKDADFSGTPRNVIQYVMEVSAAIQYDFVNQDVLKINNQYKQAILLDPTRNGGGYSLWYSEPVGLIMGTFNGEIPYSSLFHEMGHNFTLNTPSSYISGGKIDGLANAIFSESLAQIFQHATGYEILNNPSYFGISPLVVEAIKKDVNGSFSFAKSQYQKYIDEGKKYSSWNDPSTPSDETFGTFITLGYKFLEYGNTLKTGYRIPTQRLMKFIQNVFDADTRNKFAQNTNSDIASKFRATLMVTAISAAYGKDFREDFRTLNFPIDDEIYQQLTQKANLRGWVGINSISSLKLCPSTTAAIEVLNLGSDISGLYTIELSDVNGNFNSPLKVGEIVGGNISSTIAIPTNIVSGNRYRLRVVSSDKSSSNEFPFDLSVIPPSPPSLKAVASTLICKDASITLEVIAQNTVSYQWQKDEVNINGANNSSYVASQPGNYRVIATTNGCNSASQPIVLQASRLSVQINSPLNSICPNERLTLEASVSGTSPKLQWKLNDKELIGENTPTLIITQSGTYTLTATEATCTTTSNGWVVRNKQTKPSITQDGLKLTASNSQKGYQWYIGNVPITGATSQVYTPQLSGKYSVLASPEGCESTLSEEVAVVILAINSTAPSSKIQVESFPNPTTDMAQIKFSLPKASPISLSMYNESGAKIKPLLEEYYPEGEHSYLLDTHTLANGNYIVVLKTNYGAYTCKMQIIK